MTSGLRDRVDVVDETDDSTDEDFWWRLWIGEREVLIDAWAGEAEEEVWPEEFSNSEALVGGEEAKGDDF